MKIKVLGLDGAKANFGIATMVYDMDTGGLDVEDLLLVETEKTKSKQVRVSSDNLRRCREIAEAVRDKTIGCVVAFGEVPTGGQSADACMAFGMVIGIYASLTIPMIEVSPAETKLATVGTRTASKEEMIEWAYERYPNAPWLLTKRQGVMVPIAKNEHLADACAVVHAGIKTQEFQKVIAIAKSYMPAT
jgi:Holliday junction resolvasome RuvABC endonuclease subunit